MKLFSRTTAIDRWVANQTRFWEREYAGDRDFDPAFQDLNDNIATVFIFDFRHDRVGIRHKPSKHFDPHALAVYKKSAQYAEMYLNLFRELISNGMRIASSMALDVYDISLYGIDAPVFSFQKKALGRNILIPDIDFFWNDWYDCTYAEKPWSEKRPIAVFAGSSTGGDLLTFDDVRFARSQRLDWARSAVDSLHIDFRICDAVQCDTPETEAELRAQPYFHPFVAWEDQLSHRYILSLDGNGATCSRVVKALQSQSILFKAVSDNMLYYYDGLQPYRHYIPVRNIRDVERAVDDIESGRLSHQDITRAANAFFRRHLERNMVLLYTRRLLERYDRKVVGRP